MYIPFHWFDDLTCKMCQNYSALTMQFDFSLTKGTPFCTILVYCVVCLVTSGVYNSFFFVPYKKDFAILMQEAVPKMEKMFCKYVISFFKWLVEWIPFAATSDCMEQLWPLVLLSKCLSGEEWHVDWDDSSVRSSVRHMAIGDEMWRLVAAMLVTYSMSSVTWPRWCCTDGLTGSAFLPHKHTDSHTWYFFLRILHYKPPIIGIYGTGEYTAYTSTPI